MRIRSALWVQQAETVAAEAANELDMILSGEVRYSGRADTLGQGALRPIEHVCGTLGVGGLHAALIKARAEQPASLPGLGTDVRGSYRIAPDRRSTVAMVSPAPLPADG